MIAQEVKLLPRASNLECFLQRVINSHVTLPICLERNLLYSKYIYLYNLKINYYKKWDRRDLNPQPSDYESPAQPLSYGPKNYFFIISDYINNLIGFIKTSTGIFT